MASFSNSCFQIHSLCYYLIFMMERLIRLLYYLPMEMTKKETWKLLELLNEYDDGWWQIRINDIEPIGCDVYAMPCWDSIEHCIISKSYWFIQRLVEQDKIDFEHMEWNSKIVSYLYNEKKLGRNQIKEYLVLMLLSISEQPIDLLISILK